MMRLLAHRTLLLMALAMAVTLVMPNINWTEEVLSRTTPVSEEEGHPGPGLPAEIATEAAWRTAARLSDPAGSARCSTRRNELPEGPVREVSVPPPERHAGSFRS